MLTLFEKVLFTLAALGSIFAAYQVGKRVIRIISLGHGKPDFNLVSKRLWSLGFKIATLQPTFKTRKFVSFFHLLIAWGFFFYLLVDLGDLLHGFFGGFQLFGRGNLGSVYRLMGEIASVGIFTGLSAMLIRRFVLKSPELTVREDMMLHPKARSGVRRDTLIVGGFILVHLISRVLGQSFQVARSGFDRWQPVASTISQLWSSMGSEAIFTAEHITFWMAFGTIMAFVPYFLFSKHLHLIIAPLNILLKPERLSIGELNKLNFDDETIEQFGAHRLEDLGWEQLMDSFACIMCFRCQQVCPEYCTGKALSPALLEINKRYFINAEGNSLARGSRSSKKLVEFAIPEEAIWACTTCGACVDTCPVNNEPMRDILEIRRSLVLMDNNFPDQLQTAFNGMERHGNPWNAPRTERMKWAEGCQVPTIEQEPNPDILWWVGCAPATDERARKTAVAFSKILNKAGVKYAVLGRNEQCTGDSARRAGNEYLFNELATANVKLLNEAALPRIVTTCPHCLHTLKNEYPAFGGNYSVVHHSQLIKELIDSEKITIRSGALLTVTYHDPCYLGRHNRIIEAPRQVLQNSGARIIEMSRRKMHSFCCGAGGAQMWKEEEKGVERVNANRLRQAEATGAAALAVGCPFCLAMLSDARAASNSEMQVKDLAEIILDAII